MINIDWAQIKSFCDSRKVSLQWVEDESNYYVRAMDAVFQLQCILPKNNPNDDLVDFETNFKPTPFTAPSLVVTTQFERDDKDLKLASAIQNVDEITGTASVLLKVPGTPGTGEGRWVAGGEAWFESESIGDRVKVYIVDHDNMLGQGVDFVVKSYTDDDVDEENQGWRIPVKSGRITVEPIGGYGFLPAGFYIKIIGQRDPALISGGKFVFNIFWGRKD